MYAFRLKFWCQVLHEITFKNAARVTKTLTFYERDVNCSQGRRGNRRCQRFVQERIRTCLKSLYVLTGDKFHLGVHIIYGCVTYVGSLLRVESAADLLQSVRYSLHVLLTGRLLIAIKNKTIAINITA